MFSISKHLKTHPGQMELGMRSLQALQVQASPSSCDMSFNNTDLPIYSDIALVKCLWPSELAEFRWCPCFPSILKDSASRTIALSCLTEGG